MSEQQYKAGDTAYVLSGNQFHDHLATTKVVKVTPTGIVVLENGHRYKGGWEMGRTGHNRPRLISGDSLERARARITERKGWEDVRTLLDRCLMYARHKDRVGLKAALAELNALTVTNA